MSEYLPYKLWLEMFINAQCYLLNRNINYHYIKNATKIEINFRNSYIGNSIHMNILYFLNDTVKKNELEIKYFPTHLMLKDFPQNPCKAIFFVF